VHRLSKERGKQIAVEQVKKGRVPAPRVLDMFAGGGSIPLEAMRLGTETYALDLNPVAYLIELCTLYYPQLYGRPSKAFQGSSEAHTWAGLGQEVLYWARWVQTRVQDELSPLYSGTETSNSIGKTNDLTPFIYLWTRTIACPNPSCNVAIPLTDQLKLEARRGKTIILIPIFEKQLGQVKYQLKELLENKDIETIPETSLKKGQAGCPNCGMIVDLRQANTLKLGRAPMGLICLSQKTEQKIYFSVDKWSGEITSDEQEILDRLEEFSAVNGIPLPDEPLPESQILLHLRKYGFFKHTDLFTARQLLLLLTYVKNIQIAYLTMLAARMDTNQAKAVVSYLGLLLSNLVRFHNTFARWMGPTGKIGDFFGRAAISFTPHFAEVNPFLGFYNLVSSAEQANEIIEACVDVGKPVKLCCASATMLPFEDEYFDAIVTDPPYYDAVPYGDLSDFFYIWLKRSVGHFYPDVFTGDLSPKQDEIVLTSERHGGDMAAARLAYEQMMIIALKEAYRVLKPDRMLTVMFYSHRSEVLQIYLNIAQKAGFELFEVSRFAPHRPFRLPHDGGEVDDDGVGDFILYFRKSAIVAQLPFANANADTVLQLAETNRPTLYRGLAELILDSVVEEEIEPLIPVQYSGSIRDRLAEYIASCEDPEQFLTETLGVIQLRRIVKQRNLSDKLGTPGTMASAILQQLGFNIPAPPQEGAEAAIEELKRLASQVVTANDVSTAQGYLTRGMNLVESVLRLAAWAWGRTMFGSSTEEHFCQIAEVSSLDRLSMGDITKIFCNLPDHIVQTPYIDQAKRQFGRPHIYKPKKFERELGQLVAIRNRVAHNKENYLEITPLDDMKQEFKAKLQLAAKVLKGLREQGNIPLLAQPIREVRDRYNRRTVVLQMEDKTIREIIVTGPIALGQNYVYLWDNNNPKPVDPVMLPLSDILKSVP
jgi:hypothetical protein